MNKFPLPVKALSQHVIVLGKTRSGKSSKMRLMVERLLDQRKRVCVMDPKGDWWGLKSSASGKGAGYEIVIFGGKHADVPINEHSGALVAELVATGNRPCLIDLKGWMPSARTKFFTAFASTIFEKIRGQIHLVIDECHNFVPQGKVDDPMAGKSLHWGNRIASEGAGLGITLISASQRPQKIHKDYLTSHETLVACKVIHPLDRNAVKDWIDGCDDPQKGDEVIKSLAGLQKPQAWVWSPEIGFGPKIVEFPFFKTYDSFNAKKGNSAAGRRLRGWASVNLDNVRAKMEKVVKEVEANDPKALRAKVVEKDAKIVALERQIAAAPKPVTDQKEIDAADQRGFQRAKKLMMAEATRLALGIIEDGIAAIERDVAPLIDAMSVFRASLSDKMKQLGAVKRPKIVIVDAVKASPAIKPMIATSPYRSMRPTAKATPLSVGTAGGLSGSESQLLGAISYWMALGFQAPSRVQVAAVVGWRSTSGHLKNVAGALKTRGLVSYPHDGALALTDAGASIAPAPDLEVNVVDRLRSVMSGSQRQAFDIIMSSPRREAVRDEVAAGCGWAPTSGHLKNVLGSLKTLEAITYPADGRVAIATWVP